MLSIFKVAENEQASILQHRWMFNTGCLVYKRLHHRCDLAFFVADS
ncbi:hypothetical protein [Vibrio cholerae]|nr:hypothetical protein [Vibrio cholerae]